MATEQFTQEEFETQLARIAAYFNLKVLGSSVGGGEYNYRLSIPDDPQVTLMVRSSVSPLTGRADAAGNDSIRLYLMEGSNWLSQVDAWTQRVPGWGNRLMDKVKFLLDLWKKSGRCAGCGEALRISKVTDRKKSTFGKKFAKCPHQQQRGDGHDWKWLD